MRGFLFVFIFLLQIVGSHASHDLMEFGDSLSASSYSSESDQKSEHHSHENIPFEKSSCSFHCMLCHSAVPSTKTVISLREVGSIHELKEVQALFKDGFFLRLYKPPRS